MILQALVQHYEDLAAKGCVGRPGWGPVKVSFALYIDGQGSLVRVAATQEPQIRGKKNVMVPQTMQLPVPLRHGSKIAANFLCDNVDYILGVDTRENPERTPKCFKASRDLYEEMLVGVDSAMAKAVLNFFERWKPQEAQDHPALHPYWEEILKGGNLVFRYDGKYAQEDGAVRRAWQKHYDAADGGRQGICLVTGNEDIIARLHPSIKSVRGAQSSGASLVSFNEDSSCSYGWEQGENAPTGEYAAFAYGTALNHLLADRDHVYQMGSTTVLYWAEGAESAYPDVFGALAMDAESHYSDKDLQGMLHALANGESVLYDEQMLDPNRTFYVLGLAPNAARLSVRFFLRNSFGAFLKNIEAHHQRLEIQRPNLDKTVHLPLWRLLRETVRNGNSQIPLKEREVSQSQQLTQRNKSKDSFSPLMAGEMLRAILEDTYYPATLLNGVVLRIRAEHAVTRGRAAILKAYYLKNTHKDVPKEVLTVALNPESRNVPYTLGRLFSILEAIQVEASKVGNPNHKLNTTIVDKYFNSASATPAVIFPSLINLAKKHLRKLERGQRIYLEKQLTEVLSILGETYPVRLNLPQQGSFQLGYYHQTQMRYTRKDKE